MAKTITVKADVLTPKPPNFLKMTDGQYLPIEAVTDDGLREIGFAYTEALVEKAQERRKRKAKE